jgi:hypothetical protein
VNGKEHKWKVCIGILHGAGKRQIRDSSEHNGQWKTKMAREKWALVLYKTQIGLKSVIAKSDAIPLINLIWPKLFERKSTQSENIL